MNKVAVLLNPSSNKGSSLKHKKKLERTFAKNDINYDLFISKSCENLAELSRDLFLKYDFVIGMGGDTTFNIMVNQILEKVNVKQDYQGAVLGMLGTGSANDIALELNISSPADLCRAIKSENICKMDVGCVEIRGEKVKKYFTGSMSTGLGVTVNEGIESISEKHKILSRIRFFRNTFFGIYSIYLSFKNKKVPMRIKLSSPRNSNDTVFSLIVFQNSGRYAGGIRLSRYAGMFNGKLQCVIINTRGFIDTLRLIPSLLLGRLDKSKMVSLLEGNRFIIESNHKLELQLDGEIITGGREIEVSLIPQFLPVIKN